MKCLSHVIVFWNHEILVIKTVEKFIALFIFISKTTQEYWIWLWIQTMVDRFNDIEQKYARYKVLQIHFLP